MKIQIGEHKLDLFTHGEARDTVRSLIAELRDDGPRTVRPDESAVLDATGAAMIEVYTVPLGMEFALHRLVLDFDGYTVAVPYTNANGYALIQRSGEMVDYISFAAAAGGVPAVYGVGGAQAARFRNGENVEVAIVGGPAARSVRAKVQGVLQPITTT